MFALESAKLNLLTWAVRTACNLPKVEKRHLFKWHLIATICRCRRKYTERNSVVCVWVCLWRRDSERFTRRGTLEPIGKQKSRRTERHLWLLLFASPQSHAHSLVYIRVCKQHIPKKEVIHIILRKWHKLYLLIASCFLAFCFALPSFHEHIVSRTSLHSRDSSRREKKNNLFLRFRFLSSVCVFHSALYCCFVARTECIYPSHFTKQQALQFQVLCCFEIPIFFWISSVFWLCLFCTFYWFAFVKKKQTIFIWAKFVILHDFTRTTCFFASSIR